MQKDALNIRKFKLFEISLITIFWLLLFSSPLLRIQSDGAIDWNHVIKVWKEHCVLLSLFLLNRFILLPFLFFRHRRVLYVLSALLFIGLAVTASYYLNKRPAEDKNRKSDERSLSENKRREDPIKNPPPPREKMRTPDRPERPEPIPAFINLLILSLLIFGFDTGIKTISKWVYSEQQRVILEKDNIETQLAFLKNQISPHFFMNTLNNIHSLIDYDTDEAKSSVIKLSKLMRHLLYESEQQVSPIKKEVEFIKSYVDLMKLRYSKDVKIKLIVPEIIPDKSIPPLLFISLLENAFKHGISYLKESFIDIVISISSDKLHLAITNSKTNENYRKSESGIGIENTRKRLNLIYKEKYILDISDRGNIFITNLTIPI